MVDTTPQVDQMMRESPAEPVSLITPVGVTKMPEPIMVPMIIPTPLKRVMLRLSSIFSALAGEPSVGLLAVGAETMGVDGEAGCSTIRPSWSGSATAAEGKRTADYVSRVLHLILSIIFSCRVFFFPNIKPSVQHHSVLYILNIEFHIITDKE